MKNQYVGDENDYLKYGLLRCLGDAGFRIGVCWMLTADDKPTDGRKTRYLAQPMSWRRHDSYVFDTLSSIVAGGRPRTVSAIEASSILLGASFFSNPIPDRSQARRIWFERALTMLADTNLLFFDPDNGLEIRSKHFGAKDSNKYLYWSEVAETWTGGASLLIFQHFAHENREARVNRLVRRLEEEVPPANVVALRSSNVLFLLACQLQHASKAGAALNSVESRWKGRLELAGSTERDIHLAKTSRMTETERLQAEPASIATTGGKVMASHQAHIVLGPDGTILNAGDLVVDDVVGQRVRCPACEEKVFSRWSGGWDGHSGWKCAGVAGADPDERKRDYKGRFGFLFRP